MVSPEAVGCSLEDATLLFFQASNGFVIEGCGRRPGDRLNNIEAQYLAREKAARNDITGKASCL
jgi:hypothetical protein